MSRAPAVLSAPDQQRLALLIEAEAIQLSEFIELLQREEALLVSGETDALLALAQEKNERYRRLQRLSDDRSLLLGRLGRKPSNAAIQELCAGLPRVLARWEEIRELAQQARELNQVNGTLIMERMAHNQAALAVLMSATDQPQLYDAEGHTRARGGGRILGSA